jgi:hypothetical protein
MLHVGLWFEELHHLQIRQKYTLEDAVLERCGDLLTISFAGSDFRLRDIFPPFNRADPVRLCDRQDPKGTSCLIVIRVQQKVA